MAKKHNIIVVGNGLFGCIAAAYARSLGHTVTVVSESRPYEASPASGCVLAPSWLTSLDKQDVADAMDVLEGLYPVYDITFRANKLVPFKAKRINPADVLFPPDIDAKVLSVADGVVKYAEPHSAGTQRVGTLRGTVLVCAGIWCKELLPDMPAIKGLYGASLRVRNLNVEPAISVYAPYKQAVMFNIDHKTVWFGDGSALIEKTWLKERKERILATRNRFIAMGNAMQGVPTKTFEGARPYVEGHKSGYLEQLSPKLWVSTGGAKNGTVLAALQALRFVEGLK
jgi:hypothetical protein